MFEDDINLAVCILKSNLFYLNLIRIQTLIIGRVCLTISHEQNTTIRKDNIGNYFCELQQHNFTLVLWGSNRHT